VANGISYTSELTVSGLGPARRQSTQKYDKDQLPPVYMLPPDDEHVRVR
jgi:hypothetical protein